MAAERQDSGTACGPWMWMWEYKLSTVSLTVLTSRQQPASPSCRGYRAIHLASLTFLYPAKSLVFAMVASIRVHLDPVT